MKVTKLLPTAVLLLTLSTVLGAPGAVHAQAPNSPAGAASTFFGSSVGSGARALGMGGAFIAIADDATAASWNPAGLAVLEKPEASLVWQPVTRVNNDFAAYEYSFDSFTQGQHYREYGDAYRVRQEASSVDFASVSVPFRMGGAKIVAQVNFQRAINFGLDPTITNATYTSIEETGSGFRVSEFLSGFDQTGDFSGGIDVYAFSAGAGLGSKVYVGGTVNLWRNGSEGRRVTSTRLLDPPSSFVLSTEVDQTESFRGTNFNLGLMLKPSGWLRIGLVFKSPFDMSHERSTTTTRRPSGSVSTVTEDGTIRWPRTLGGGFAFLPSEAITLSVDFTASNWSKATYDFTRISSGNPSGPRSVLWPSFFDPSRPEEPVFNDGQFDTRQIRVGAEYVLRKPGFLRLSVLPLRAGWFTDRQLFKDTPDLGPVNFQGLTAGLGLVWSRVTLDLAFVHQSGSYRHLDFVDVTSDFQDSNRALDDDRFGSNQLYVSTIIRF